MFSGIKSKTPVHVTIATHDGKQVCRNHNTRKDSVVSKQPHIDPNGLHMTLIDEDPIDAYERLFGDAIRAYDAKQKRSDRKIGTARDYYNRIKDDKKKSPVREMIIGVYGDGVSQETKIEILTTFVKTWKERNPNLELIGAYLHADEEGKDPHCHLDYIPVGHGYSKGMETQNGLNRAFEEMGFVEGKYSLTPQEQWTHTQNKYLDDLCGSYGLVVDHPMRGTGRQHLSTPEYKELQKELEETQKAVDKMTELNFNLSQENQKLMGRIRNLNKLANEGEKIEMTETEKRMRELSGHSGHF